MKKIFFVLIFLFLSIGFATGIPPEPMAFYGNVTMTDGSSISNGYYISAKILGVVSGECEIINGFYGMNKNPCFVESYTAAPVEFYIGDIFIGEHSFNAKEIVRMNFNISSLPTNFVPLSNGICEPEKGECSYNLLDCANSITKACVGNGVCDSAIGETCINDPQECDTCPSPSSGGSGSSGGGGSGGSSTSGGIITVAQNYSEGYASINSSTNESSGTSNSSGNSNNSRENSSTNPLTGFIVSNFSGSSEGILLLIAGGLILIGLAGLFFKKDFFRKFYKRTVKSFKDKRR